MSDNIQSRWVAILMEAMEKPQADRPAFVRAVCGEDVALLQEVQSLIDSDARAGDFLLSPTAGAAPQPPVAFHAPGWETVGTSIGRYKLLQLIGEGGFGSVFLAGQETPVRRQVALKVIKPGMDTKQVIARFEAERQALAIMDHPHIAKVLDAGATDTGRPYFVMELVRGVLITDYCDANNLSLPQRLALFVQVCQAVQHAHGKGIIHRDLKPSNVMVTMSDGRPAPKIIDFGIAKATDRRLTEKTVFTEFREMLGTPQYMSPEQAEMAGIDIDTRSDIYSLGVLLYELLVGSTPFDPKEMRSKTHAEIQRMIREVDPQRPSTRLRTRADALRSVAARRRIEPAKLGQVLKGELDWIVMRAMEKDRTRRYETADGLATDVQRHLDNEPVLARPPNRSYRIGKLVRKHRTIAIGVAAVAAALIMGVIGTGVGLFRARSALAASRSAEATATRFLREVTAARAISDARNLQLQGEDRLRHGRFTEAAADFAHAIELDPSVHWSWYLRVTILAYQGDAAAYRAECSAMFSRFGGAGDWSTVDRTVKACLLFPSPIDPGRVAELAHGNLEIAKRMDYSLGEAHFSQALALLRAGDYRESLDVGSIYGAADKLHLAINDLLSVMDLEHLHRHDEAMLAFRWGEGLVAQLPKAGQDDLGENPEDWLICQVLLREAQAVVASASDTTNPEHARNDRSHGVTSTARWNGQPGKPARVTEGAK